MYGQELLCTVTTCLIPSHVTFSHKLLPWRSHLAFQYFLCSVGVLPGPNAPLPAQKVTSSHRNQTCKSLVYV